MFFVGTVLLVLVHTADKKGAGTDSQVSIKLRDSAATETPLFELNNLDVNDYERDAVSRFHLPENFTDGLIDLDSIILVPSTAGEEDAWFVDLVEVVDRPGRTTWLFPVHRWLHGNTEYRMREYDLSLPQDDDADLQSRRQTELTAKREMYQYLQHYKDFPPLIKVLPEDEKFSDKYTLALGMEMQSLMLETEPLGTSSDKWTSFQQIMDAVNSTLGAPDAMEHWDSDKWFGAQRLQGTNPALITLCTRIPDNLGVDKDLLLPFLEGFTLRRAIRNNKMFIVDLAILEGISHLAGAQMCPAIALFYLNKNNDLMPVAIQLFQQKGADNPVFVPSDPPNLWLLAKMFYNNAEAQHHEVLSHLGFTHLMMEGMIIGVHRHLAVSHPLFRLLAPHFLFNLAAGANVMPVLLSSTGSFNFLTTIGADGAKELLVRGTSAWRLDENGVFPNQIAGRGVADPSVLPYYPYRDDGCDLYAAIERYVRTVVASAYSAPGSLQADHEVQQWRRELTRARDDGGVGMLGVAGDDEQGFSSVDQVVEVVTAFISTCSQVHAAVNFGQYDEYGFMPNYPIVLYGSAPTTKDSEPSEQELMNYFPGHFLTRVGMVFVESLSFLSTNLLGDFEVRYMYDPIGSEAAEKLREELRKLTKKIDERNAVAEFPYKWQSPAVVPNSISA